MAFCLTPKMSHADAWRGVCVSTICDKYPHWLHRFVRLRFHFSFRSLADDGHWTGTSCRRRQTLNNSFWLLLEKVDRWDRLELLQRRGRLARRLPKSIRGKFQIRHVRRQ